MAAKRKPRPSLTAPLLAWGKAWGERHPLELQSAGLALLALAAYWNSLASGFHFDDFAPLNDPYVTGEGFGWEIFRLAQTRPLTYLTFHWNYLAGGADPQGYHWVNLLLHIANAVLVLVIAGRHLRPLGAACAAALFALHPLQTEAVTYVFSRSTLLATFFALLAFLFFLRGQNAASAVAFAFSLLAKEETVALPAFLLLYDYFERRRPRAGYYAALAGLVAMAAARLFYVLHTLPDAGMGFGVKGVPPLLYALTQARVVWTYLRLFLFPAGLNLDHDVALSQGLLEPPSTLAALLGLALILGALTWLAARRRRPALWALGFLLLLAPSSSVVSQADLMFEHRTYFPLFSLVIVAAAALGALLGRLPVLARIPAAAVLILALTMATISRNRAWLDERSLWTDVLAKSPKKARAYLGLARAVSVEDPARSRQLLEQGLALDPNDAELHSNLGVALLGQEDASAAADALEHFERAMALTRENAERWNNIGAARFRLGQTEAAIGNYNRALQLDPCSYNARRNLVFALSQTGKKEEAVRAGEVPGHCRLLAAQAAELAEYRKAVASSK